MEAKKTCNRLVNNYEHIYYLCKNVMIDKSPSVDTITYQTMDYCRKLGFNPGIQPAHNFLIFERNNKQQLTPSTSTTNCLVIWNGLSGLLDSWEDSDFSLTPSVSGDFPSFASSSWGCFSAN